MNNSIQTAMLGLILMVLSATQSVAAKTYKCKDASGAITYSQKACPPSQKTAKVMSRNNNTPRASMQCDWAGDFSESVANGMRRGRDVHATFDDYGGVNALSKGAINIINYVYGFKSNDEVSVGRIRSLAGTKCQARSFGPVACSDLPRSFSERRGGCDTDQNDPARRAERANQAFEHAQATATAATPRAPLRQTQSESPVSNGIISVGGAAADDGQASACKARYKRQLDALNQDARSSHSSRESENMRAEARRIRHKMSAC